MELRVARERSAIWTRDSINQHAALRPSVRDMTSARHLPVAAILFLLPLAFDFRSDVVGGTAWQFVLVALTLAGGALFMITPRIVRSSGRLWLFARCGILLCIAGVVISSGLNNIPFDRFIRVSGPFLLFAIAVFMGELLVQRGRSDWLVKIVLIGCGLSIVVTVMTGFQLSGSAIADIRYQILSPVMLPFQAVLLYLLHIRKVRGYKKLFSLIALLACIVIQLMSATRSAVLGLLVLFVIVTWMGSSTNLAFLVRIQVRALQFGLIALVALVFTQLISPEVTARWYERIAYSSEYGFDPTTLTRVAEIQEQLDLWRESWGTILLGKGYGAEYGWAASYFRDLLSTGQFTTETLLEQETFQIGHNFWVGSLFTGGLLFGLALPTVLVFSCLAGLKDARRALRLGGTSQYVDPLCVGTLMLTGVLMITIGGNPFGARYPSLIAGLGLGMLLVARTRYKREQGKLHFG